MKPFSEKPDRLICRRRRPSVDNRRRPRDLFVVRDDPSIHLRAARSRLEAITRSSGRPRRWPYGGGRAGITEAEMAGPRQPSLPRIKRPLGTMLYDALCRAGARKRTNCMLVARYCSSTTLTYNHGMLQNNYSLWSPYGIG